MFVIDAKTYKGQLVKRASGGLRVGKRNGSSHVEGVLGQRNAVSAQLPTVVPVFAVLCYVDALWLWYDKSFNVSGVHVCGPAKLRKRLRKRGHLSTSEIQDTYDTLLRRLRAA